ncbi:MAG TPA: hypothetical protein VJ852_10140 [Gemmatimonadaceae bacterium]|nr:hypothetical protein [Gemmatimonadaceae bacterium]
MRSVLSAAVVALVVGGCSSASDVNLIAGTWHQDFGNIPGNSFQMTLFSTSSGVAGTGYGCGEAGTCGASNITGTVEGRLVHLTIIATENLPGGGYRNFTEKFDGMLLSGNVLSGKLTSVDEVGLSYDVTFHRGSEGGAFVLD